MSTAPLRTPKSGTYDPVPLHNEDDIGSHFYNGNYSVDQLPSQTDLAAPRPRFLGNQTYADSGTDLRGSYASSQHSAGEDEYNSSVYNLQTGAAGYSDYAGGYRDNFSSGPSRQPQYLNEKNTLYAAPKSRRKALIWAGIIGGALVVAGVVVAVYFAVIKPHSTKAGSSSSNNSTQDNTDKNSKPASTLSVTGRDGSTVTTDDGSTFTYTNQFGGYWYWDPSDPFNNAAKPNSWTPALNETFQYGTDKIYGVNLGGWLTLEPFISPAVFEPYANSSTPAVDEYTLHPAMRADTANGGISQLENHYKTFITEQDFAAIAGAGLNYVRIPLPYWAIEVRDNEPFEPKLAWTYFLKAIQWARKYGLRINLDFHALPGSQNGWNHSGKLGGVGVLNGPMGLANAQRSLDYIRILAEFISQPEYKDVVTMFGVTNEPQGSLVGKDVLSAYYFQAYNLTRLAGGTGQGNGPVVSFHDGFFPRDQWAGFMPNADRIALDSHPYICFGGQSANPMSSYATTPCTTWGQAVNASMSAFGMTAAGEWSNAVTDCGLWVNGLNLGTRYEGTFPGFTTSVGSCTTWTDYQNFDQTMRDGLKQFALASMDALQNWFFWTWKIGNSTVTGKVESPQWSYSLGLEQGWMPTDPRQAIGVCGNTNPWTPPLTPAQLGGAGAGDIPASATLAWPPASITGGGAATALPTYTPTGAVPTLPVPTFTASAGAASATSNPGTGWTNQADTAGLMVNVAGCNYLDPWVDPNTAPPSPLCS